MSLMRFAVLYAALALGANTAFADMDAIAALRDGDMKKLVFHSEPAPLDVSGYLDPEGGARSLDEYRGKYVLLNFWATWCAPCRKEMPGLDALQVALGGADFQVVPVATGRNKIPAVRRFFDEVGVENLPILLDPQQTLAREMGVFGLPVSMILDREGREIARLRGDADWNSESARAIIQALIAGS